MFNTEGFAGRERMTKDLFGQPEKSEILTQKRKEKDSITEQASPEFSEEDIENILELSPFYEEMSKEEKNEEREIIKMWLKENNKGNA